MSPSDHRRSLRALNLSFVDGQTPPAERPSHSQLRQLDSSLKRCTGFIRKLKTTPISEKSIETLIAEANLLNLSRYISEIAGALADIKLKSSDVPHLVLFCGHLHRRYHDFTSIFIDALTVTILNYAAKSLVTRKAAVKLLVEMFTLGLYFDVTPVLNVLRSLIRAPKESKDAYDQRCNNLIILSSFAKNAAKVLLPPAEQLPPEHPDAWQSEILPIISKNNILSGLQTYFDSDVQRLFSEATENVRRTHAALSRSALRVVTDDPAVAEHDATKQTYEKLLAASNALAEAIGKPPLNESPPDGTDAKSPLDPSYESTDPSLSASLYTAAKHKPGGMESVAIAELDCPFEEEEQRLFYTELVTLKLPSSKSKSPARDQSSSNKNGNDRASEKSTPSPPETHRRRGGEKAVAMDRLLNRLSSMQTRQDADKFALDFAVGMETAKNAPKRLSKILYPVSSQKLNLLPAYARVAANLKPVCPDMVAGMVSSLEDDFKFFVGKSDVDEKELALCVKTAQYVGEYVKFSLIDVVTACDLLTLCLKDFSGHRVDAGCHLLETCGRYLYLTLASHPRMINMLDTIWRLKSVRNLEARHNALIETAYFSVRVSSSSAQFRKKTRPPLHEYVRHLLYNNLNATNIRWTLSQLLKLPWDAQLERYVISKFVNVYQAKYSTIVHIASLIAYMTKSLRDVSIGVVDMLLEAIRAGMERNDGRESQRRIAEIRLLGELYNCNVIEEKLVYNVLYQLITLGHETNHEQNRQRRSVSEEDSNGMRITMSNGVTSSYGYSNSSAPDPVGDFFRIRLVCLLLETCGTRLYAANGRKVEVFWIFLERYVYCKARQSGYGDQLPLHIEQLLGEVFQRVLSEKPPGRLEENVVSRSRRQGRGVRRSQTLQQAVDAVSTLERNGGDCMLIAVPDRQIVRSASTRRGAKGGGVRGNVVDGFQTVGAWDEEEEDDDETDHDEGGSDEDDDDDEQEDEHEYYYREGERDRDGRDRRGARNEEEEAFARELASMTASAVQTAKATVRVTKLDRMTIPMSLMVQKLEEDRAAAAMKAARSVGGEDEGNVNWAGDVQFKLLVRKGGKSQLQGIAVPATSSLAVAARESESANAQRHEETKRLILGSSTLLSDDDGEDDMQVSAIQHARQKQENIRMQRDADERELLCSVFRKKGR